jgi:UDP-N-acetylglucosamine 2-epimerase
MNLLVIAAGDAWAGVEPVIAVLRGDGIDIELLPFAPPLEPEGTPPQRLAAALTALEPAIRERAPARVLVAGEEEVALAAALVSTKLQVPTAYMTARTAVTPEGPATNGRLIELIADATLALDATAVGEWLREARSASAAGS